jgi:ABC-type Fe3+ transport system permease subunit
MVPDPRARLLARALATAIAPETGSTRGEPSYGAGWSTMPARQTNNRRPRTRARRNATFELAVAATTLALIVGGILVFVLVYHDLPFRLGGP